ncbi:FHA domain-containing protein [Corallococcus exercitus]|uniref:FHA domain-containing protein n=1 Tax=Corallococcus exercitus TaxID=2316736 RepID=UPI0035D4849D
MKIGRTSENDLVLHDHGVSRRHARITAREGRYFAEDVGSANGTQLNGQPLAGEKQLRDGDRITVGPVEFTFVWVAPEDDDDVTRPIRRALAPPHAKVSPQGVEQASLAEIEAAPTSYQQSMPAMARPASLPRPGMAVPAAKGGAAPAMPVVASATPKRPSAPDLPAVGAAPPVAAAPARTPVGPPVLGASVPGASVAAKPSAGPPVLGAVAPGAATPAKAPAGPPVLGPLAPGLVADAAASNRAPSGPPVLGASAPGNHVAGVPARPPVLGASSSGRASASGLPAVGASPAPGPVEPAASPKRKAVANLPGVGAPALNRPELGRGAARASAASVSGLPLATPPGLMAPPPPARPPVASPPVELAPVMPDEPEERTLMAIPTVDSPVPASALAPVLPVPDLDEPAEHTLMAIPTVDSPEPPSAFAPVLPVPDLDEPEERTLMAIPATPEAPPLVEAAPPLDAAPVLPAPTLEEPEERTVLDLRPITPVSPLVARPMRIGLAAAAPPAPGAPEPATFVGQDDDIPADPPEETRASPTFAGQDALAPAASALAPPPAWSPPVPPPSREPEPEPVTLVGRNRSASPPKLDAGPLPGEAPLLAPALVPAAEGDAPQSLPPGPETSALAPVPKGPVTVVAKIEPSSAADKARQRRQLGKTLKGRFLLFWQRQSLPRRIGFASLAGLGALAVVTLLVALAVPSAIRLPGREPFKLGLDPVTDSFGLGEGVRWVHADDKLFDFRFVSPTRAVAVLHYQASNIARDEVNLSLNGVSLGWVPPDTAQTAERELEQVLPPSLLRRNANNQLLFDNALNPPGRDPWRIWNLRLEVIPVPELPPDQLVASARESAKAGARFYELKDVGAENLFKAWREYRAAWITLEALDDKPELYDDVRERIAQISTELDHRCGQLMMQFQRAVQFRSRRDAVATLEDVRRRFPTAEHRCHNLGLEKAYEHEL